MHALPFLPQFLMYVERLNLYDAGFLVLIVLRFFCVNLSVLCDVFLH